MKSCSPASRHGRRRRAVEERSGLPLDPYFSAGKLAWLLANDDAVRGARDAGTLRLGTVDAFLSRSPRRAFSDRPVDRVAYAAARRSAGGTGTSSCWPPSACAASGCPTLGPTFGPLGELRHERWPVPLALARPARRPAGRAGGSGAIRPGELKATYGTGVFVLGRTAEPVLANGLLPTIAWAAPAAAGAWAMLGRRRHCGDRGGSRRGGSSSGRSPTRSTAACSPPGRCSTGSPQGSASQQTAPRSRRPPRL